METHLNWYEAVLRPAARSVINILVAQQLRTKTVEANQLESVKNEFYQVSLKKLDAALENKEFVCTEQMSTIDIVFYNEITTVMYLDQYNLKKGDYPHLFQWLKRMSELKEVKAANE